MARKVFISVLGTGFYSECRYQREDFLSSSTRFIQIATLEKIGAKDWDKDDVVYVLLTDQARKANWTPEKEETYYGLAREIEAMHLPCRVEGIKISDGANEEQIWEIFNTIYGVLQEGDELYFDLTHAFRFLPMLMLVMSNYAHFLRNTQVKEMVYGNFEARDKNANIAPMTDLLPLMSVQEWSYAAGQYLDSGSAKALKDVSLRELSPYLDGSNLVATESKELIKHLDRVVKDLQNCRGKDLYKAKFVRKLKKALQNVETPPLRALSPILETLQRDFDIFVETQDPVNGYVAAQWCFQKGLYQQSITLLQESLTTLLFLRNGLNVENKKLRIGMGSVARYHAPSSKNGKKYELNEVTKPLYETLCTDPFFTEAFAAQFNSLSDYRNDYNHAGMTQEAKSADKITTKIEDFLFFFHPYFYPDAPSECPTQRITTAQNNLFLNLSNHPYSTWSEGQKAAARTLGELEELPFPEIAPEATEEEIAALAEEYVQKILAYAEGKQVTVHLMGELTFCFALVRRLEEVGITCVASCSRRDVEDLPDGRKQSAFHFSNFRRYVL